MIRRNKLFVAIASTVASFSLCAGTMGEVVDQKPWYGSIGTGYSWTHRPGIDNPNPSEWDYSAQGYNGFMGNSGFITFSLGKQVHEYIDLSVMYIMQENFNYQKFQSGTSATPDFTGNQRNRYFTLNNKAVLVNGFLHADQYSAQISGVKITPYIGAGIGYAYNYMTNFYTIGNQSPGAGDAPIGSTDSIGTPTGTSSFSWQGTVAFNVRPNQSHVSVDTGYRYFDGGEFKGPTSVYTNLNGFTNVTPWSGRVKADQFFVDFKYTV